jgi:hypothetical protein
MGLVALAISCAFAAAWIRSFHCSDEIQLSLNSRFLTFTNADQCLVFELEADWEHFNSLEDDFTARGSEAWNIDVKNGRAFARKPFEIHWKIGENDRISSAFFETDFEGANTDRYQFAGLDFGFQRGRITSNYGWTASVYLIPWYWLTFPFIALSAWLLLRPKPATRQMLVEAGKLLPGEITPRNFTHSGSGNDLRVPHPANPPSADENRSVPD